MINVNRNSNVGYRRRGGFGPVMNVSNCENSIVEAVQYDTFENETPTGFDAIGDGAKVHRCGTADEITIVNGKSYYIEFDLVVAGTAPVVRLRESIESTNLSGVTGTAAGSNAITLVATGSATGVVTFYNSETATNYQITNLSVREIL